MISLKPFLAWYRRSRFDEECRSVGRQAVEVAMQHGYNDFALVSFRLIDGHMHPIVEAMTPEENAQIRSIVNP